MSSLVGEVLLGQFRVEAFLASGGMGTVYRAWDMKRNVFVAMKVLHAELAEDPLIFKHFQREARALEKLVHPNIVSFYGIYQTRGFAFLLERYVDGPSLKNVLTDGPHQPLPMDEILIYFKSLCAALGYAHAHGVVHCDVKPGNLMIDRGGHIYLTDFGIARHADSTVTTVMGSGTPAYMAPEQVRDEPVTPATDIYALGVILFELLTGQRPFRSSSTPSDQSEGGISGQTSAERIRLAHLTLPPPHPRSLRLEVSDEVAQVVLKALAKNPLERYQSTQALFNALCQAANVVPEDVPERILLSDSDSTAPLIHKNRLPDQVMKRRLGLLALTTVFLVSMVSLVSLILFWYSGTRTTHAITNSENIAALLASGVSGTQTAEGMDAAREEILNVESTIVFQSQELTEMQTRLTQAAEITQMAEGENDRTATALVEQQTAAAVPQLTGTAKNEGLLSTQTAWANATEQAFGNAVRIAFFDKNDVWVAGTDGKILRRITDNSLYKSNIRWMPDGRSVLYIQGKCIYSADIFTLERNELKCFDFVEKVDGFEISADGRYVGISADQVLYIGEYNLEKLRLVESKGQLAKFSNCYMDTKYDNKYFRFSPDGSKIAVAIVGMGDDTVLEDYIQVYRLQCGVGDLGLLDRFPGTRFRPIGFDRDRTIQSFGWDGEDNFALVGHVRDDGYGNLYLYNIRTHNAVLISPLGKACCYRDPSWSLDGQYFVFAYQDADLGGKSRTQLYYIPADTLQSSSSYSPLPLSPDLLTLSEAKPQPEIAP